MPTVTVCDYSTCIITRIDQLGFLPNPLLVFEWFSLPSTHTLHCVYYARLGSCVCRISHGLSAPLGKRLVFVGLQTPTVLKSGCLD